MFSHTWNIVAASNFSLARRVDRVSDTGLLEESCGEEGELSEDKRAERVEAMAGKREKSPKRRRRVRVSEMREERISSRGDAFEKWARRWRRDGSRSGEVSVGF